MKILPVLLVMCLTAFPQEFTKLADNLNFPEGPAWDHKGSLYVSSCYGGYIYKIAPGSSEIFVDSSSSIIRQTNGLTVGADGNIYACEYGRGVIIRIYPDKRMEIISEGFNGTRYNRPNDLAFFRDGDLFFTDPKSYGQDKPDGRLFRLNTETGQVRLVLDSLCFPNGIAFSDDYSRLYVCESAKNRVLRLELDKNGDVVSYAEFAEMPGGDPDGLAFDQEGSLYVAHFGGSAVYVFDPDGNVIEKITAPGKKPSNVEFGGTDLKTLFITEDETNSVYSIRRDIPGLNLVR